MRRISLSGFRSTFCVGSGAAGRFSPDQKLKALDRLGCVFSVAMLAAVAGTWMAEQNGLDREAAAQRKGMEPGAIETAGGETMVAGYLGAPYTYASNVRINNPAEKTDFTMTKVGWDGKPFKSPIYYRGARGPLGRQ